MTLHDMDPWTRCCIVCGATKAQVIDGSRDLECPGRGGVIVGITHRLVKAKQERLKKIGHKGLLG